MQVCLVTPPSGFLLDERVFVTLGILKVASSLEQAGHDVDHLDLSGVKGYIDVVARHCMQTGAKFFGITATTPQLPAAAKVAAVVREMLPDAKVCLGGPHITLVSAAAKKGGMRAAKALAQLRELFDILVAGDGEDAIHRALAMSSGLVDADDPKGALFLTNSRLDATPMPARHLVDMSSYHYSVDGVPALSMIAQLGCPFACAFCGGRESPMLRRIRMRSTANVLEEMRHLHSTYGVSGYMMYDDELNVSKTVVELMNGIAELGKGEFRLRGFVKSELFTDEQAAAMHRAGFRWLLVGFESGSPRILENINKKATAEDNTRCLQIAHAHGIKVKALMSLGHAGESKESVEDTRRWLLANHPDDFDATIITTYPGTPYYDKAVETAPGMWTYTALNGDRLHAHDVDFLTEEAYYKGVPGEYSAFVYTDYLSSADLVAMRDALEADVRAKLGIPFNPAAKHESSMGQRSILRSSSGADKQLVG